MHVASFDLVLIGELPFPFSLREKKHKSSSSRATLLLRWTFEMVKDTAVKSSVGLVTSAPSRSRSSSIVEAIPEALASGLGKRLGEFITSESPNTEGSVKHSCGEEIESELMDAVEQILLGNYRAAHFINLLKSVNLTAENKPANVSVANVLWLWGTQVSIG